MMNSLNNKIYDIREKDESIIQRILSLFLIKLKHELKKTKVKLITNYYK